MKFSIILCSSILLSLLLCVFAVEEDARCIAYTDSCSKCIDKGCAWCSDGFCIGLETDICPPHRMNTTCTVPVKAHQREIHARQGCSAETTCADCLSLGCVICEDASNELTTCAPAGTTCANIADTVYNPSQNLSVSFTYSLQVSSCPVAGTPSSGPIPLILMGLIIPDGVTDPIDYVTEIIIALLTKFGFPGSIKVSNVGLVQIKNEKRGTNSVAFTTINNASGLQTVANNFGASPSGLDGVFDLQFAIGRVANGNVILIPSSTLPQVTVIVNSTVSPSSSSDKILSRGALAGIIIGCIVFGLIVAAIIAYLIFRRRESYPLPFRSPAAAYRP